VIDDSKSMLFTEDGFVAAREQDSNRHDIYIFGYGSDHREALQAFYTVSGKPPVLPRWAFGNWWSRFCKRPHSLYESTADNALDAYTDKEYIELMDRFKEESIPLSVGVIDMDWLVLYQAIGSLLIC
jgi:alpha-glucosidase (family GH31 glycosyl hydrolase)